MSQRQLSGLDKFISNADRALRTLTANTQALTRDTPSPTGGATSTLNNEERKHAAGLMRVNHAGEVCAQALYQGQSLTAKLPQVRDDMETAADEEIDHLAWCEQRLNELDSRTSMLNPLWYGLSFGLGAATGAVSDRVSLGFVAATENQVCQHLEEHLEKLPKNDHRSRAIVKQMLIDEGQHAHSALAAGGVRFPAPIKAGMTLLSKAMTKTSYRF